MALNQSKVLMRQHATRCADLAELHGGLGAVGGGALGYTLGAIYYPAIYTPRRIARSVLLGVVLGSATLALYTQLFETACTSVNREFYGDRRPV